MNRSRMAAVLAVAILGGIAEASTTRSYSGTACVGYGTYEDAYLARSNGGCYNADTTCEGPPGALAILPITGNDATGSITYSSIKVDYYADMTARYVEVGGAVDCSYGIFNATTSYTYTLSTTTSGSGTFNFSAHLPNSGTAITGPVSVQHLYCHIPPQVQPIDDTGDCSSGHTGTIYDYTVTTST